MKPRRFGNPGEVYGRLTVVEESAASTYGLRKMRCVCTCGNEIVAFLGNLRKGNTLSCGCLRVENTTRMHTTHGQAGKGDKRTKEYRSYEAMKRRCRNVDDPKYPRYGGRGITVCARWLESFENFFADMGVMPAECKSIDRKELDGNYEPDNCRWATSKQQAYNTSRSHRLTFNGKTQTLMEWAIELDVKYSLLENRINRRGWSVEQALTAPAHKGNRRL